MKVTKKSQEDYIVRFIVDDSDAAFVNTLRRAVIDKVPTMAIEDIEFRENNSVMYDEMLAHRLGLVSLKTDLQGYTFREGEGGPANECTLTLEAEGPTTVTASMFTSKDPKVVPTYGETILVELLEGQKLSLVAKAILGRGQEHAKWSAGLGYYQNVADVQIKEGAKLEAIKELLPPQAVEGGKVSAQAIVNNDVVDAVDALDNDAIKVTYNPNAFDVTIESWGQHSGTDVVALAVDQIKEELSALKGAVEALK